MLFCRFDYSTNRREMRHRHRYRCYQSVQWFDTKYAERVANWIPPRSVRRVRPFHRMKGGPSQRAVQATGSHLYFLPHSEGTSCLYSQQSFPEILALTRPPLPDHPSKPARQTTGTRSGVFKRRWLPWVILCPVHSPTVRPATRTASMATKPCGPSLNFSEGLFPVPSESGTDGQAQIRFPKWTGCCPKAAAPPHQLRPPFLSFADPM